VVIGKDCKIGPNACIGPYTSLGDYVIVSSGEVENSIVMSGAVIDCEKRIVDSIIGKDAKVLDSNSLIPKGHRLILGDSTYVTV